MNIFNLLFKKTEKTDKELQDEIKALVNKVIIMQRMSEVDQDRYEKLLYTLYQRNLTPADLLEPKDKDKKI